MITPSESRAIVTLCLMAAFVDGDKHERERDEVKRIAEGLAQAGQDINLQSLYQDVLMKRVSLADQSTLLTNNETRQLAYEMAVCVCDADGAQSQSEQLFLNDLRSSLGLDAKATKAFDTQAAAMASAPLATAAAPLAVSADNAELDQAILNAAILNGALELLPETLSTMAIIPLQMKLVYRIGKAHGYELDSGHVKDFIATVGVGLTSQYLEQAGRKLLGGLLGKAAGKTFGKVGRAATGMVFSFATTYALGQVAKRYYAGGRTMSTALLQETFQSLLTPAKQLQQQYLPQMEHKAQSLDMGQVMSLVRGV